MQERQEAMLESYATMLKETKNKHVDSAPELMVKVMDMIKWSKDDVLSDNFYSQPHLFQPPIEAISALGYGDCCRSTETPASGWSYSWRALQDMLIKVNNNLDYDADKKAHNNFDTSFRKLHSLAKGSFNESRHFIQPEDPTSKEGDPTFKQDSIEGAGRFIIRRIRALKTGADTVSGAAENRATNGPGPEGLG
ncbi:hypothetical protein PSTG_00724 [Puccinia striiformis f. sp. tritici PST-78]|uniref:Uncharacterized protein n=1 Tax=Puccinia striiformis f. sp. tritici PST-78 TaxID=1165861 RepID=A0A0L0W412_9BASI|nr:hypothetical protein PSTG_00724 [Puccinia striiformis f. sp. tritici PST-78]